MTFQMVDALVGAAIAVVGGIAGGLTPLLAGWLLRPRLQIDFKNEENNIVTVRQVVEEEVIYVRARVQNEGHRIAKSSRVFLTALYEVLQTAASIQC